jgi:hypothetical protein
LRKSFIKILLPLSIFLLVIFLIFIFNQTIQVISIAANISPFFGKVVTYFLVGIYLLLIIIPIYLYLRLPKILKPPENNQSAAMTIYLEKLGRRLKKNKYVSQLPLTTRREIEEALNALEEQADRIIKQNSATVFVTTSISQSGRLDTFTVLIAQIRMIWQIAIIYYQRPSLRDLIQLYANVLATAFIAGELNEIDISRQMEPIVTSVLGASLTGSIPGVNLVAGIVTNSLLSGSANAYLTLRVGIITKRYCGSLTRIERASVRRSASLEAARWLSNIVMTSAGNITKSIVNAAVKSPGKISRDVLRSTWGKIVGKGKVEVETQEE